MPDMVIEHLNRKAHREGYSRGPNEHDDRDDEDDTPPTSNLRPNNTYVPLSAGVQSQVGKGIRGAQLSQQTIRGATEQTTQQTIGGASEQTPQKVGGATNSTNAQSPTPVYWLPPPPQQASTTQSASTPATPTPSGRVAMDIEGATYAQAFYSDAIAANDVAVIRTQLLSELYKKRHWHDKDFAFVVSVKVALKNRPKDALPAALAEVQQHLDTPTFHLVHNNKLTKAERMTILRS